MKLPKVPFFARYATPQLAIFALFTSLRRLGRSCIINVVGESLCSLYYTAKTHIISIEYDMVRRLLSVKIGWNTENPPKIVDRIQQNFEGKLGNTVSDIVVGKYRVFSWRIPK